MADRREETIAQQKASDKPTVAQKMRASMASLPTNFLSWKGRGRKEKLISATGKTKDGKPKDKPKSGVKPKDVPALSPRPTEDGKEEPPSSDREQQGPAASDRAKAIKTKT